MISRLSTELSLNPKQIASTIELLDAGNTVPFIARYRKEATGSLDEVQIRAIEERVAFLKEIASRKKTILETIESQGKLTDALRAQIEGCDSKTVLEDIYLPFKPKRRTRAMIARERGLEPLAQLILQQPVGVDPITAAQPFVNAEKEVPDVASACAGAQDIVAETVAETPEVRAELRKNYEQKGIISSRKNDEITEPTKFEQYYDFKEPLAQIPSHRYLALARGERENVLRVNFEVDAEPSLSFMRKHFALNPSSRFAESLQSAIADAYKRLLAPSIETEVRVAMKMKSDRGAIEIFAQNLRNILLAAPMGTKSVIGIDPGLRTGCKCAVVTDTGKFVDNTTIYLSSGADASDRAQKTFLALLQKYPPYAVAIGNGTGGRETEALVRMWLKQAGKDDVIVVSVSESGASVYSASDVAREEFPDLDLTIRGAISIARRLQDPLAELVKVEPKAMGVGQYQHDVYQPLLDKKLGEVVESCVNQVGVELNTASAPLLSYVAGIGATVAKNIVAYREEKGAFGSRKELKKVPGVGARTFEQAAGFLRIRDAKNPLDASAVHPERYDVVEMIAKDLGVKIDSLVGNLGLAANIDVNKYVNAEIGVATLRDIVDELKKPGRDPRSAFERPEFRDDVNTIADLKRGMVLNGVVTNVTAFGAFVDIGVHQDGLVHISELSEQFVTDPASVVSAGDRLKVEVLDIDAIRKRISLSARIGKSGAKSAVAKVAPSGQPSKIIPAKTANSSRATLGSLADFARFKSGRF
jgi:uncharacterized protein